MTQPSPGSGASHGDRPAPDVVVAHIVCRCQLRYPPWLALCGVDVTDTFQASLTAEQVQPCAVCLDLGRTALVSHRCERCAR